ncbi:hypothetical protein Pcar_3250 [Syntrophotalea carbinolica DSM 2380]|uniref:Uncharacterized protein n=1 Tax=Syntrophotalea carbinolica (strain DSM 2380 / NBRC 103641 / GraBd1) TaxID=338963 RepID=Q0C6R7_SYNC1|nr:hypothetical protein Pcar_3250 [Syntrophotalea carbinolica DSM 2380]
MKFIFIFAENACSSRGASSRMPGAIVASSPEKVAVAANPQ